MLNRYLTSMSDVILRHGGTLVAYMGDGIMAVFGAPIEQPTTTPTARSPPRARWSARRWTRFNDWLRARGPRRRLPDGHRPEHAAR